MVPDESRIKLAVGEHFRRTRETLGWTLSDVTERAAREGANISVSMLSRLERGQSALSIGDVAALCRSLGTSFAYLEELIALRSSKSEIDITGQTYDDLMKAGRKLAARGEYALSLGYFEAAVDWVILQEPNERDPEQLADAMIWCAVVHRRERRFGIATEIITKVLNLPIGTDTGVRALALNVTILYMTSNFGKARILARQLEIMAQSASTRSKAYAIAAIGSLHFVAKDYAQAIAPLSQARDLYAALSDDHNRARIGASLGLCLAQTGQLDDGLAVIRASASTALNNGHIEVASQASRFAGQAYLLNNDLEHARAELERAASLSRRIQRMNDVFLAWFWVWKLEAVAGDEPARKRIQQVLSRLLSKVDPRLSEAEEFLATIRPVATAKRKKP